MHPQLNLTHVLKGEEMTPNDLEILIHCYVSPEEHPRINAPAVMESIGKFVDDDILEERITDGDKMLFKVTEKGVAFLRMILSTPYPIKVWINPRQVGKEAT